MPWSASRGRVEEEWMAKAAKRVDMMLLSANVQVTVPQAVREANPDTLCLGYYFVSYVPH